MRLPISALAFYAYRVCVKCAQAQIFPVLLPSPSALSSSFLAKQLVQLPIMLLFPLHPLLFPLLRIFFHLPKPVIQLF